jgi:hypothetical protein
VLMSMDVFISTYRSWSRRSNWLELSSS